MLRNVSYMALIGRVFSAGGAVNYMQLGDDWPTDSTIDNNECAGDFQSPIDLRSNFTTVKYEDDKFFKHYEDLDAAADQF